MLIDVARQLIRRRSIVNFDDFSRIMPISRFFGLDRGTPIDRYYIEKFLAKQASHIKGRVLEVANNHYSKRYGADRVTHFEILYQTADSKATIVGDLTDKNTLPANIIDCFICTQTFNFIFDVRQSIEGAYHMLKPGGVLLATLAGLSQISRYDMDRWGDYWRFTTASANQLFSEVFGNEVEVTCYGNLLAAKALLDGLAVEDLPDIKMLDEQDPDYQVIITVRAVKGKRSV